MLGLEFMTIVSASEPIDLDVTRAIAIVARKLPMTAVNTTESILPEASLPGRGGAGMRPVVPPSVRTGARNRPSPGISQDLAMSEVAPQLFRSRWPVQRCRARAMNGGAHEEDPGRNRRLDRVAHGRGAGSRPRCCYGVGARARLRNQPASRFGP